MTRIPPGRVIRHKFHAKPTTEDGIRFASKKEASYYRELRLREKCGEVIFFLRQVPLYLPGGVRYIVDFVEFSKEGMVRFVDVKGYKTPEYRAKKKMVEALYPIRIEEA